MYKGECAANEVMTGLALNLNGQQYGFGVMGARCSRTTNTTGATACVTQIFQDHDAQEIPPIVSGDWDPGFLKGQCGQGLYMKGLAHDGHGGRPLAILCCTPGQLPHGLTERHPSPRPTGGKSGGGDG
jgi:hypothetical protein